MHVFFSGIGGSGHSGLALLAHQAGYDVSGSDQMEGPYIDYLRQHGIKDIHIGQTTEQIAEVHAQNPIDWLVFTSALPAGHPELDFSTKNNIKLSKRDEFLNKLIEAQGLKLIAIAGTHGKTTTSAMAIWLFKQLDLPISYLVGGKISFGDMAQLDKQSQYFIYECDEFDRNFLCFYPEVSLISGIDWDHPDIYPTRESYNQAFLEFIEQSQTTYMWHDDAEKLALEATQSLKILDQTDSQIDVKLNLAGHVNRLNAWLVAQVLQPIVNEPLQTLINKLNKFPGVSRRFEKIIDNLYSDYAHTPPKIRGALQLAHELAGDNVVVIYEGLHNTRQHFIKDQLRGLFDSVKKLYIVPSYLAREDESLEVFTPVKLLNLLSNKSKSRADTAELDSALKDTIKQHILVGDLVLCLSAGGAGSLGEWLRQEFS